MPKPIIMPEPGLMLEFTNLTNKLVFLSYEPEVVESCKRLSSSIPPRFIKLLYLINLIQKIATFLD